MIYGVPSPTESLDQGDIIHGCPLVVVESYDLDNPQRLPVTGAPARVIIVSQACDLANQKATAVVVYREHLAKHMADTYSRIGLPQPYETD
jgi:hypothetical protein